jgi:hypothetical protein
MGESCGCWPVPETIRKQRAEIAADLVPREWICLRIQEKEGVA